MKNKRRAAMYVGLLTFTLSLSNPVLALHDDSDETAATMAAIATAITVPLIININRAVNNEGSMEMGFLGIVSGLGQVSLGILPFIENRSEKWQEALGGALIGFGIANVGAGVFAISRRGENFSVLQPGVATSEGLKPGLTLNKPF